MTSAAAGWYHAEGDPPGTERYWDGTQWTEGPRPIGGVEPTPPAAEPTPGGAGPGSSMPELDFGSSGSDAPEGTATPDVPSSMPEMPTSMPPIDGGSTPPTGPPPGAGLPPLGVPTPGMPPGGPGLPAASMGAPPGAGVYTEASKATTALILSIVGFFCCGLPAAVGVYFAREEQQAIKSGRRDPSKQGLATAALVVGIIGLVLWGIVYLFWIIGAALV